MWINTETLQWPLYERDIRALYPDTSFPTPFVAPEPYAVVFQSPRPEFNAITQFVREVAPQQVDGVWSQQWEVVDLDADQAAANQAAADQALEDSVVRGTQARLDTFAQTRGYDGILSACTYSMSTVEKFATEGQYCVGARDATWAKLYEMLAEVQAGTRPKPAGYADVEPELPVLEWPV